MKKITLGRKQTIIGSLAVALLILGSSFTVWALSTNKGEIIASPASQPVHASGTAAIDGTYIYFIYDDTFKRDTPQFDNGTLETYILTANTNYEKHLSVSVQRLETNSLTSLPSYTARESHPDLYHKQQISADGTVVNEYIKKDNAEKTIFIQKTNTVAIFSFTTASQYDDLDSQIDTIMRSFKWKQ